MTVQSQSKQGERHDPMTRTEFELWAEVIGLSHAQWSPVWYVIGREYERGQLAAKQAEGHA